MIKSLLQFDDVRPACGGVRTLEVVLDGVEVHKALIDGVTEKSGCFLADDTDQSNKVGS